MEQQQVEGPSWYYISSEMYVVQRRLSSLAKRLRRQRDMWDEDCSSPFMILPLMAQ